MLHSLLSPFIILILAEEKVEEAKSTQKRSLVVVFVSSDDDLDVPVVEERKKECGKRDSIT